MANAENKNDVRFDNRIVQRNIRSGRVNRDEYERYLASLPDLQSQCEEMGEEIYRSRKPGLALTGEFSSHEHDEE
ncbi:MAG TPA: hypothetical protein VEL47_07260 [Myxococcota bacterium]|nr:hypothetical protein [Myxococcota bacterium]